MYIYLFIIIILYLAYYHYYVYESFSNNSNSKIPKIIIQTWKTNQIPLKYKEHIESVKNINKNFKFLFFTDQDIEKFLKENYPDYYLTYMKLPIKIQKIDFFRYVAVYHYGGFYYDLDMKAMESLDNLVNNEVVFPIEQKFGHKCNRPRFKYLCDHHCYEMLGNYAFGAIPKNTFLKTLIENIHYNIDNIIEKYQKDRNFIYYVYQTTGPDYISLIYKNYVNKKNITILENIYDPKKHYFGKYAVHTWAGTWKRK